MLKRLSILVGAVAGALALSTSPSAAMIPAEFSGTQPVVHSIPNASPGVYTPEAATFEAPALPEPEPDPPEEEPTARAPVSGTAAQLIEYARGFLGVPYVYGGSSPSGFDCSGFTMYVYAHFGVTLPRVSADQGRAGTQISLSELAPGDLVAWDNSSRNVGADHVAIYVGGGNVIAAPYTGAVVREEPIFDPEIAWGVRVL